MPPEELNNGTTGSAVPSLPRCQFHQHFKSSFLYESVLSTFYLVTVLLCNFLPKEKNGAKVTCKMLMKLIPGVSFINIL